MKSQANVQAKDLMVGVTSHKSWIIIWSSFNPFPIHLLRWIGLNAHWMRIGFQVDSCERNKLDWMHIRCSSQCPCERALKCMYSKCPFVWPASNPVGGCELGCNIVLQYTTTGRGGFLAHDYQRTKLATWWYVAYFPGKKTEGLGKNLWSLPYQRRSGMFHAHSLFWPSE